MRLGATSQLLQFGRGHPSHFYQLWAEARAAAAEARAVAGGAGGAVTRAVAEVGG